MKPKQIIVQTGNPLTEEVDGLIHPITGAELTKQSARFPDLIEMLDPEARQLLRVHEPLHPGGVVVTPGGDLPCRRVAHVPIEPATDPETYRRGLRSALEAGLYALDQQECESCLIPAVPSARETPLERETLARLIVQLLLDYAPGRLNRILLVDEDGAWIGALIQQLEQLRPPEP